MLALEILFWVLNTVLVAGAAICIWRATTL